MHSRLLIFLGIVASVSVVGTTVYVVTQQPSEGLRRPYRMPSSSPLDRRVAGAGIVEAASRNIRIGSFASGIVAEVPVVPGQQVRQGEMLFRLDARQAQASVAVQQAALNVAEQQLAQQKALPRPEDIPIADAAVTSALAAVQQAANDLVRANKLDSTGAVSAEELDAVVERKAVADANLASARGSLQKLRAGAWSADLQVAEAEVAQARAALQQAQTTLALQTVTAPIDGEVLQVNVRAGEFVSGTSDDGLIILGDTSRLHVRVDIDEVDIPRLRQARTAVAYRRGDPQTPIPLTLVRIEPLVIPKQTLTGESRERIDTRVLQAVFAVEAAAAVPELYVGQQLDVFIPTDQSRRRG